jgi:hypothetical protein
MVSFAAPLFRAIAPISGYQLDIDKLKKRMSKPVSLFLHHAQDDNMVRITGCCTDPTMPGCCCGISNHADQCVSAETHVGIWASQFNQCGDKTQISYSVQDQVDCTTFTDCQGQRVNTTYCIYQHKAHFNRPSFEGAFSMSRDIADFFARDACSINGGSWDSSQRSCSCASGDATGIYCLLFGSTKSSVTTSEPHANLPQSQIAKSTIPPVVMLAAVTLMLVLSFLSVLYLYRRKRSRQRYVKVSTRDVELARV